MSEKKIVVPGGMLKTSVAAAVDSGKLMNSKQWTEFFGGETVIGVKVTKAIIEAALRWLSENPIVPDVSRFEFIPYDGECGMKPSVEGEYVLYSEVCEWQRRMFDAPEPELPSEDDICEIGATLRDRGIRISNAEVGELLAATRKGTAPEPEVDRVDFYTRTANGQYLPCEQSSDLYHTLLKAFRMGEGVALNPKVPSEIADLMWSQPDDNDGNRGSTTVDQAEFRIREAFNRGKAAARTK